MIEVETLLDQLNDHQRQAVSAEPSNLLVLAGAGSGKTRVLVYRLAWLMTMEHYSPMEILAVTFTNKAAKEMNERVETLLGIKAHQLWMGTFHGLAHRLLRAHWEAANLPQNFQIIDSDDQLRMIKRIMKEAGLDDTKWPPKQAQWFINQQKEEGRRAHQMASGHTEFESVMLPIYQTYEALCQQSGLVDFSELLLRVYELFRNHSDILAHYQKRFRYILVDEFQDTNKLQYAWLKLLATDSNHTMIVGDDDQSIYSWRGAKVENLHRFQKDYPQVQVIRLEQNYRSTGNILKAANQLISENEERMGKNLWTESEMGEPISVYAALNEIEEAKFIVDRMKHWYQMGHRYSDFAILYRSNAQSRILEEALLYASIPYRIYGGLRFYERAEIKDALAYLRLVTQRQDDSAFERIINTPPRGIGDRTIMILRERAKADASSLWQALQATLDDKMLPSRALSALAVFAELIDTLAADIQAMNLAGQVAHVIHHSSLLTYAEAEKGEKARARVENLEELIQAAREFDPEEIDENLSPLLAFLTYTSLESGEHQAAQFTDYVQLMTVHSAKGLEFPVVFLAGLEEGLFPHQMSMDGEQGLAEERRLCYVAMTRAMKKLYLTYAESRSLYGQTKYQRPSRFLSEIPADCVEEVRLKSKVALPLSSQRRTIPKAAAFPGEKSPYRSGQYVRHEKFGTGVVMGTEGSGEKMRIHVNFKEAGAKWLMAEYAKLEIL